MEIRSESNSNLHS